MTEGKVHEQKVAPSIPFEKGDVVVFDRGYNKLKWLKTLDNKGVFFVTRLKTNSQYRFWNALMFLYIRILPRIRILNGQDLIP